jgi:hypothetical protein
MRLAAVCWAIAVVVSPSWSASSACSRSASKSPSRAGGAVRDRDRPGCDCVGVRLADRGRRPVVLMAATAVPWAAGRLTFANGHRRRIERGEGGFKGGDLGAGVGEALIDGRDEVLSDV